MSNDLHCSQGGPVTVLARRVEELEELPVEKVGTVLTPLWGAPGLPLCMVTSREEALTGSGAPCKFEGYVCAIFCACNFYVVSICPCSFCCLFAHAVGRLKAKVSCTVGHV